MLLELFFLSALTGGRIDPDLADHIQALRADEPVRVLVHMDERYDATRLLRDSGRLPRRERAAYVEETLRRFSARSQSELSRRLATLRDRQTLYAVRDLWIVNACAITCNASDVAELVDAPGVERIAWDPLLGTAALEDDDAGPASPTTQKSTQAVATANIIGLQANQLWRIGVDGHDVLVLTIDSGVANDHPDLANHIWSNPGETPGNGIDDDGNGFVDDVWGWDFFDEDNDPYGDAHGTRTAGILVGDGTSNNGVVTGMAPGATLAVARVGAESQMLAAYQYAITIGADCVSSSHSMKWPNSPDYATFRAAMTSELAAGIIHANSTGNQGMQLATYPTPWNIAAPANCPGPWIHPQQLIGGRASTLAVGGIYLDDTRYGASGEGPSAWEDVRITNPSFPHAQDSDYWDYPYTLSRLGGLLKPDVVAYTGVKTTDGNAGHLNAFGGTSAAAPHVGGAMALLLDANERVLPRQISQALQETAVDLGETGKDRLHGAGKIQVYDAALRVLALVTAYPNEPELGEVFELELTGPQGSDFILGISDERGSFPTPFGFDVEIASPVVFTTGTLTGDDAPIVYPIYVPPFLSLSGLELYFQLVADDTQGFTGGWLRSLVEPLRIR